MPKLPPDKVPDGLTAQEYERLSLLYQILGRSEESMEASRRGVDQFKKAELSEIPLSEMSADQQMVYGSMLGREFSTDLLKLVEEAFNDPSKLEDGLKKAFESFKPIDGASGADADAFDQMYQQMLGQLQGALSPTPPPSDVPEGLSASEYYELGKSYKAVGWTEHSRDALRLAMVGDSDGEIGKRALTFMQTKLPRHPVPLFAEQGNIAAYNLMHHGDKAAKAAFKELIVAYPDFEWPYGNLGTIYLRDGELDSAQEMFISAVKINPFYVNAWSNMARVHIFRSEFHAARACINKAGQLDPDENTNSFMSVIEQIESWET